MARLGFLIGGVQKAGTSALARALSAHPQVRLPRDKEAHVFDAPDYPGQAGNEVIDARFAGCFGDAWTSAPADARFGDATPITLFHPVFIDRAWRYNPALRWIVLLREPAERAISQWHMEHRRGDDAWPLWAALLGERWRLRGHESDFSEHSPLRHHAYLARGDYARQLDALYARFPREQVLVLDNAGLAAEPAATLDRVQRHLGLDLLPLPDVGRVFEGGYPRGAGHRLARALAHWLLRRERAQLKARYGLGWQGERLQADADPAP